MRRVMATIILASLVLAGCVEDTPDAPEGSGDPWPTEQAPLSQSSVKSDAGNAPPRGNGTSAADAGPASEGPADDEPASDEAPAEEEPVDQASAAPENHTAPATNETPSNNATDTSNTSPPPSPVLREVYNRTHQFSQGNDARTDSIAVPAGTKILTFNLTTSGASTFATDKDVRVYDASGERRATCATTCGLVIDDPASGIWTVVYAGSTSSGSALVTFRMPDAGFSNAGKPLVLYDRDHDHASAMSSSESFVVLPGAKLLEVNMTETRAFGGVPLDVSVTVTVYDPDGKSQYRCTFSDGPCTTTFTPTKSGVWLVSYGGAGSTKTHTTITAR